MPDKGAKRGPLDYALGVISRRRVSRGQMLDSLRRKGYPDEESEGVLLKLSEWGYLNDKTYAQDILQTMLSECPLGKKRAEFELSKRRFDRDLIETTVHEMFQDAGEGQLASSAAKKYLSRKTSGSVTEKERERLARWLQRRGFCAEAIYSVLDNLERSDRE